VTDDRHRAGEGAELASPGPAGRRARGGGDMARSLRILIAEDEPLNALALESQLEALGHTVIARAHSGTAAVELARRHPPDLAILDVRMPGMSGIAAAGAIFQIRPIPIILLTGYRDPESVDQALRAPVFHYLLKPVSLEELAPAIGVACSRFEEWQRFQAEAAALEQKLEERTLIEQAKRVIMEERGLSEPEAYRLLQRESQNRNEPMAEIARAVLVAHALLRGEPPEL